MLQYGIFLGIFITMRGLYTYQLLPAIPAAVMGEQVKPTSPAIGAIMLRTLNAFLEATLLADWTELPSTNNYQSEELRQKKRK